MRQTANISYICNQSRIGKKCPPDSNISHLMQKDDPFRTATIQWFSESDIDELTDVWEASVRKTHDFLNEHEILLYRTRPLSCHALPFRHPHRENDRGVLRRAGRNDRNAFRRTGTSGTRVGLPPARSGNPRTESYASRRERAKSPGQDILPEKRIPDNGTRRIRSARNQASDPPSVATRKPASERFGTK